MVIFKKRNFFKKHIVLGKLKGWVGKIVSLSLLAGTAVLISSIVPQTASFAQAQGNLKLQAITVADIDANSLEHLLSTPLQNLGGTEVRISDYQDKIIVLNFWASWCPPCIEEMPDLEAINNDFKEVQVIGYGVDSEHNIRRFLDKVPVDFTILIGEPTALRLMRQLGNPSGGLPFSLIFSPGAELAYKIIGQVNTEELRAKLVEMGS
ncbi:MAG: TlpA disulfide reductase family protein [Alcaligenaceae bacterium]|nr:TlpA disulfide reductase family protein [Alcaligenaceae bacterium]